MSVSPSSAGDAGDTDFMVTEEVDIGEAGEVTSSQANRLYVEFRKYVSMKALLQHRIEKNTFCQNCAFEI